MEIVVNPKKKKNLQRTIDRLVRETGRSVVQATTYIGIKLCEHLGKLAKPAPKLRPLLQNPLWQQHDTAHWIQHNWKKFQKVPDKYKHMIKQMTPFVIETRYQPFWQKKYIPTWREDDERREIKRRGLARRSFKIARAQLADMSRTDRNKKFTHNLAETARVTQKGNTYIRIISKLTYIEKAFPKIKQTKAEEGAVIAEKILDAQMQRHIARAST